MSNTLAANVIFRMAITFLATPIMQNRCQIGAAEGLQA
jgi:hypothetical protein